MSFVLSKISFLTDLVNKSQPQLVQLVTQEAKAEPSTLSCKEMVAEGKKVIYVSLVLQQTPRAFTENWPSQKVS